MAHELSHDIKSGYAHINGINMYYEIYGEGEVLVLIHGGGSTIQSSFGRLIPLIGKNRKIVAMELQAHGRTSDRDADESFEQDADDVAALLQHLNIKKASFLGFSNGGNTAMQIAIRHPQLVQKLILGSTIYKREGLLDGFFEGMQQATIDHMPQVLKDAFLQVNPNRDQLQVMFNKDRERMLHFKSFPESALNAIQVPVFVIATDRDVASNLHTAEMYSHFKNPQNRLMIVSGAHGCYIEAAESSGGSTALTHLTVEAIEKFLAG